MRARRALRTAARGERNHPHFYYHSTRRRGTLDGTKALRAWLVGRGRRRFNSSPHLSPDKLSYLGRTDVHCAHAPVYLHERNRKTTSFCHHHSLFYSVPCYRHCRHACWVLPAVPATTACLLPACFSCPALFYAIPACHPMPPFLLHYHHFFFTHCPIHILWHSHCTISWQ